MLKGKGRKIVERNLVKFNGRCLLWQRHCSISRNYGAAGSTVTERRAKTDTMLIRRRVNAGKRRNNWFCATAGMGMRRRFAVHAWKAGQGEQIKRKYAAKPFHVANVTKKRETGVCTVVYSICRRWVDVACSSDFYFFLKLQNRKFCTVLNGVV